MLELDAIEKKELVEGFKEVGAMVTPHPSDTEVFTITHTCTPNAYKYKDTHTHTHKLTNMQTYTCMCSLTHICTVSVT